MDDPQPIDVERKAKDESNLLSLLTLREREVFELLRLAKQNKEIANALVIAERAARFHVENITRKLGRLRREILTNTGWNASRFWAFTRVSVRVTGEVSEGRFQSAGSTGVVASQRKGEAQQPS